MLGQDTWGDLVNLADELEERVIREMAEGEFTLGHVAGVGLAEDGMAVSGHDLAGVQGGPKVVLDGFVAQVVANSLLHLLKPVQNFLVGPVDKLGYVTPARVKASRTYNP